MGEGRWPRPRRLRVRPRHVGDDEGEMLMSISKKVGAWALALLLCAGLVPAASLSFARQAWADDGGVYALYYRTPNTYDYTLVIQKGDKPDARFGTFVENGGKVIDDGYYDYGDGEREPYCNCDAYSWHTSLAASVTKVIVRDPISPHDTSEWFSGMGRCVSMDLSKLDTSKVTNMSSMFSSCSSLKSLNLGSFNTANVTTMADMFYGCEALESVDVSRFNTAKVTDMSGMFMWCDSLKALSVASFNTANVTDMSHMFYGCDSLAALDLSRFNMSRVLQLNDIFPDYGSALAEVRLPASGNFRGKLPTPEPEYVDGAVGTWVDSRGTAYRADQIPSYKAETYRAKRGYSIKNGYITWPSNKYGERIWDFAYTGKAIKPAFGVEVAGKTLKKGRDYTITFKNNKKVGEAKVTIKGKGNYSGKLTATFNVVPKGTSIKKVKGGKKSITVTWKRASSKAIKAKQVSGYAFRVSTDKKGSKIVTYYLKKKGGVKLNGALLNNDTPKATKVTLYGLKSKKKYYVSVAVCKKKGSSEYYSAWSKPKAVRTK